MSLYFNNAAEQPKEIYYKSNSLNTVYFNGDLVWQRVADYTDWETMIKTVEDKESGAITGWPQEYIDGCFIKVPLTSSSAFWGGNNIDLFVKVSMYDELTGYVVGNATHYADVYNLKGYTGYINSIPRAKCQELYNVLPFKNKLKPITVSTGILDASKVKIYTRADGTQYFDDAYQYGIPEPVEVVDYITLAGALDDTLAAVVEKLEVLKTEDGPAWDRTIDTTENHWYYTINPGYGNGAFNPENYYYEVWRNADGTLYDISDREGWRYADRLESTARVIGFMKIGA